MWFSKARVESGATHGLWVIGNGLWGITPYNLLSITHDLITREESFGELLPNMLLYRPVVE
jgi:hypothetical protein